MNVSQIPREFATFEKKKMNSRHTQEVKKHFNKTTRQRFIQFHLKKRRKNRLWLEFQIYTSWKPLEKDFPLLR